MKKFLCILLFISIVMMLFSCEEKTKEEELSNVNILDYVFFEIVYGEVTYTDRDDSFMPFELHCVATLKIKPKGDYVFKNTSCTCTLVSNGILPGIASWNVSDKGINPGTLNAEIGWKGVINLDKDGYGEITVRIRQASKTTTDYPKESDFTRSIVKVTGSVIIK